MKILSRFLLKDGSNGYMVEDNGITYPQLERGLYDTQLLESLIATGYKIMDYHGNIITPDNINIKDMVETPCTVSEAQLDFARQLADAALTEAEASVYFSREVSVQSVDLKPSTCEINTREELYAYLDNFHSLNELTTVERDIRPLNSFVKQDAMFTIEEIATNSQVQYYMKVIESRRKLRSFDEYERLCNFLKAQGVLGNEFTPDDVKTAYLSWGLCGVRSAITDMKLVMGVVASIYALNETVAATNENEGRSIEFALLDRSGNLHYGKEVVNPTDYEKMEMASICPLDIDKYNKLLETSSSWDTEYKTIKVSVTNPSTRMYLKLIDESGLTFTAKVDNSKMVIMDTQRSVYTCDFLTVGAVDYTTLPISVCSSREQYQKTILTYAKVRDIVRSKTMTPPVKSTYDLCVQQGMSPVSVLPWAARAIKKRPEVNASRDTSIDYSLAAELYKSGPDKKYIAKYNPDDLEYNGIDELIDIMVRKRDQMIEEGTYLNAVDGFVPIDVQFEMNERPVENLEFARDVLSGELSFDDLHAGILADGVIDVAMLGDYLQLVTEIGQKFNNITEYVERLKNIETAGVTDLDTAFIERHGAFRGYMRDKAMLNNTRARECDWAVYITRIYRELANVPAANQRHYAFECLAMDLSNKEKSAVGKAQMEIANALIRASKSVKFRDFIYREAFETEAASLALKVMFGLKMKQINVIGDSLDGKLIELPIEDGGEGLIKMRVEIPTYAYNVSIDDDNYRPNRFCTLYDWSRLEMYYDEFRFYCLNANLTPWRVTPKPGVRIPSYSYHVNALNKEAFVGGNPAYLASLEEKNAKVSEILRRAVAYSLNVDYSIPSMITYEGDAINNVLNPGIVETPRNYLDRFKYNKNAVAAKGDGKFVEYVPLKSDIDYANYWRWDWDIMPTEVIIKDIVDPGDPGKTMTEFDVLEETIESRRILMIEGQHNVVGKLDIREQSFGDLVNWIQLVSGMFKPEIECLVQGVNLIAVSQKGKLVIDLNNITLEQMQKLATKKACYQLNSRKFVFVTKDGMYYVEVK